MRTEFLRSHSIQGEGYGSSGNAFHRSHSIQEDTHYAALNEDYATRFQVCVGTAKGRLGITRLVGCKCVRVLSC